ncbi:MAG: hypothetical protein JRC86_12180 [Deltaproteobacteria bacterium]|nr:hypothetical protein [Deltaproteobacteria bacterium]
MTAATPLRDMYCRKRECLIRDCREDAYSRGLCLSHYNKAQYLVGQDVETWWTLEERSEAMPRKTRSPVTESQLRHAIRELHKRGCYPSIVAINFTLGRRSNTLKPADQEVRNEEFEGLGIEMKSHG